MSLRQDPQPSSHISQSEISGADTAELSLDRLTTPADPARLAPLPPAQVIPLFARYGTERSQELAQALVALKRLRTDWYQQILADPHYERLIQALYEMSVQSATGGEAQEQDACAILGQRFRAAFANSRRMVRLLDGYRGADLPDMLAQALFAIETALPTEEEMQVFDAVTPYLAPEPAESEEAAGLEAEGGTEEAAVRYETTIKPKPQLLWQGGPEIPLTAHPIDRLRGDGYDIQEKWSRIWLGERFNPVVQELRATLDETVTHLEGVRLGFDAPYQMLRHDLRKLRSATAELEANRNYLLSDYQPSAGVRDYQMEARINVAWPLTQNFLRALELPPRPRFQRVPFVPIQDLGSEMLLDAEKLARSLEQKDARAATARAIIGYLFRKYVQRESSWLPLPREEDVAKILKGLQDRAKAIREFAIDAAAKEHRAIPFLRDALMEILLSLDDLERKYLDEQSNRPSGALSKTAREAERMCKRIIDARLPVYEYAQEVRQYIDAAAPGL